MIALVRAARERRWAHIAIANLRIVLGFAFLPAGLKKVLGQPFTDPSNTGAFHEFLHGFHATGVFYQFVGSVQLAIAVLLMTQTLATVGALAAMPVFATIAVFCWATGAYPTAFAVTLMLCAALVLIAWDVDRCLALVSDSGPRPIEAKRPIHRGLWRGCGAAILVLYLAICAASGGIYRPKGIELDNIAFYTFPLIAVFPIVALIIELRRK